MRKLAEPMWIHADQSGGPDSCWTWLRNRTGSGYGVFRGKYAHRLAYEMTIGPVPPGLFVCHRCNNPLCINPRHLYAADNRQNILDARDDGLLRHGASHHCAKLSDAAAADIRRLRQEGWTQQALADKFGVTRRTVRQVLDGETWRIVNLEPIQVGLGL